MFNSSKIKIKKIFAILLSFIMIICSMPIITNAAEITKENSKEITVSKWMAYGHEIHKGKNADGNTIPFFCLNISSFFNILTCLIFFVFSPLQAVAVA